MDTHTHTVCRLCSVQQQTLHVSVRHLVCAFISDKNRSAGAEMKPEVTATFLPSRRYRVATAQPPFKTTLVFSDRTLFLFPPPPKCLWFVYCDTKAAYHRLVLHNTRLAKLGDIRLAAVNNKCCRHGLNCWVYTESESEPEWQVGRSDQQFRIINRKKNPSAAGVSSLQAAVGHIWRWHISLVERLNYCFLTGSTEMEVCHNSDEENV